MFRKIILAALVLVISVVGYLLINRHSTPKVKAIEKVKAPLVVKKTYFYVYKDNEKKGSYLNLADIQKKELKPGQTNIANAIKSSADINFNNHPIMRSNKTKGQTISDKDYSLPKNDDYGVLLSFGGKNLPFQITVSQPSISKYVFVGGRVDIYALMSANSDLSSSSGNATNGNYSYSTGMTATKSNLRFRKILSNVLVRSIKSTDSVRYKIDLAVSADNMQDLLLTESVGKIFVLPHGKNKSRNNGQKLLSSFGFNNVIEIHV